MAVDTLRVRKTLAFLLRHRPDVGHLLADEQGWIDTESVTQAVCRLTRCHIGSEDLVRIAMQDPLGGFQVTGEQIRALPRTAARKCRVPDILYYSASREIAEKARDEGFLGRPGQTLQLHTREQPAWLAAHRRPRGEPMVLYVDGSRAGRGGIAFRPRGRGQFVTERLPTHFVLNLRTGFGVQVSAGGFLVQTTPDGTDQVGLVKVRRRSGVTWEVAKGKMEIGETPLSTAKRELTEEMGLQVPLQVEVDLGISHYGFSTPAGEPRLKVLHLFVLRAEAPVTSFSPAVDEGIEQVAFFDLDEAIRVVTHGSLREPVRRLRRWLARRAGGATPTDDED